MAEEITQSWIVWIPTIIAFFVVISLVVVIISIGANRNVDIDKIQQSILRQRFLYNEDCLAYRQDRVYSGIIDLVKFDEKRLQDCFNPNDKIGVQLTLRTNNYNKILNINPLLTDKFNFCFDEERVACSNYTYYVLINDHSKTEQGFLDVAMIKLK